MNPFFLDSRSGPLLAIYWPPVDCDITQAILHVPAFAEEMNKSRHMVASQAKILAEQGYAVLVFDLFGTGDSVGDFGEATWELWLANIADAVNWLKQQGAQSVNLWGLRLGALLAIDFISRNPGEIRCLAAWQPVLKGDTYVTQFLRLRIAATMMNRALPPEKTNDLIKQLLQGHVLEVAGYRLHPDLIKPLIMLEVDALALKDLKVIKMFEIIAAEQAMPIKSSTQQLLTKLTVIGVDASLVKVIGEDFWASQEVKASQPLLQTTGEALQKWL